MAPTRLYVRPLLALHRAGLLKAAAHITGGGLPGNLPRVLPDGRGRADSADWPVPPVFGWLARTGGIAPDGDGAGVQLRHRHGAGDGAEPDAALALLRASTARRGCGSAPSRPAPVRRRCKSTLPDGWPA